MSRPRRPAWPFLALAGACALLHLGFIRSAPAANPSAGGTPAAESPAAEDYGSGPVRTTGRYAFWSDPDVNLHHFLYRWARATGERGGHLALAERDDLAGLSPAERQAWSAAVDFYRQRLASHSLIFSTELAELRDRLAGTRPASRALESEVARSALEVLDSVRPLYRRRWWPAHDRANRGWIDAVAPRVESMEEPVIARLEAIYGASWPPEPIRVDVSAYAGEVGAYTNYLGDPAGGVPPHSTVSSLSPGNQLPQGAEIVFHESLHSDAMEKTLNAALAAAFGEGEPPQRLWHRILFYTSGEAVRDAYAAAGTPGYRTYSEKNGLWERSPDAERSLRVLDEHWKPFLEGRGTRDEALAKIAAAITAEAQGTASSAGSLR